MFNTLKYAKMLEDVGFSQKQAETSIGILVEIMEDKLATKQDLQELRLATQQDLQELRLATQQDFQELKQDFRELKLSSQHDFQELRKDFAHSIAQVESKLTIRMGTMLAASIAILTAIQKLA